MLNAMSIVSLTIAFATLIYSLFLAFKGRKINRGMMFVSAVAALWATVSYVVFVIDTVIYDILSRDAIREFCIKPMVFVQLCANLAWVIRGGWRNDH